MEENNFDTLYSNTDKQILKQAEDSLNPKIDRANEIIKYAKEAQIRKIGIAISFFTLCNIVCQKNIQHGQ